MNPNQWLTPELINLTQKTDPMAPPLTNLDETATLRLLHDFLEILDSFDRLVVLAQENNLTTPGWGKQLNTLHSQVVQALERAGVSFDNSLGQNFDPARHEAVGKVERDDVTNYTIIEVLERGCTWHGKLLRAARVIVARHSEPESVGQEEYKP